MILRTIDDRLNVSGIGWGVLLLVVMLTGCNRGSGDGGGNGNGIEVGGLPESPFFGVLAVGLKSVSFGWSGVNGAFFYRLLESPDGVADFSPVAADLAADVTGTTVDITVYRQNWAKSVFRVAACNNAGCTNSNDVDLVGLMPLIIGYAKATNTGRNDLFGSAVTLSQDGTIMAVGSVGEASNDNGVNGNQADDSMPNAGAVYVFTNDGGVWTPQAYVKASNTGTNDQFGASLALSADGTTLAVGAPGEASTATGINGDQTDNSAGGAGAVYIFSRSGATWTQQAYVKASNTEAGDSFGSSVALSGDGATLVIGAIGEASAATGINGDQTDNSASVSGAGYIFTRSGDTWTQQAYVKASNTNAGDQFGASIDLSADGTTFAVGAYGEASNAVGIDGNQADDSAPNAGAVYAFMKSGATWTQQAYVKASNTEAGDSFGSSVALSGDGATLVIGAIGEASAATGINGDQTDNSASVSGAGYIFTRSGDTWTQQAYVKASNTNAGDQFGASIDLSADGTTFAVGAYGEASNAVGIDGNQADNSAPNAGAVYAFMKSGAPWTQQAYVKAGVPHRGDAFGWSVALSGNGATLSVGVLDESSNGIGINSNIHNDVAPNSGAVYLY